METPTVKIVPVKTFENNSYSMESYTKDMIEEGMSFVENEEYELKGDWKYGYDIFLNKLLGYVEEKELQKLHSSDTDAYKRFQGMFQQIAEATKTNFIVVVGHIELCVDVVSRLDMDGLKAGNMYPTIVLVLACYSEERLRGLNEFNKDQAKLMYMGFSSLMHVYDGEIYQCPNPFVDQPSMECRYKGSDENLNLYHENSTKGTKLVECAKARIYEYEKAFVEAFQKRKCKKIKAEDFIQMVLKLKKDELHFWDHETLTKQDEEKNKNNNDPFQKAYWIVDPSIGTPCTAQSICAKAPNEMNIAIGEFDKETRYLEVYKKIIQTIRTIRHDVRMNHGAYASKMDQQLESYFHSLSKEDAEKMLEYNVDKIPVFFTIILNKLKISTKLLFSKYKVNFSLRDDLANETILFHIIRIHNLKNSSFSYSGYAGEKIYTTKELYRLFLEIYKIDQAIFLETNESGQLPLAKLFTNLKENYPLILFYFRYFPNRGKYGYGDSLLHTFFETVDGPRELIVDCLEMMFINGINPNETLGLANDFKTLFEVYVDTEEQFYQKEIINLFVAYGFKNKKIIEGFHKYYYDLLTNTVSYNSFIKRLQGYKSRRNNFILQNPSLYIRKAIEAFSLEGPLPKKMELSELAKQIEKETKPYEEGFEKINSIKDLFKEIQQFVKKLKIEQAIKNDFLEEARRIYMSKNGENENEGNSAVRRYSMIESIFQEFKQLYAPEPEPLKKPAALPPINAWGGAFKKTRKRNQKKKTRRTKRG